MILYYITDRKGFAGTDARQQGTLLRKIGEAARASVDYIQLREKDLLPRELERLAREAVRAVRENSRATKLLVNSRTDVALACSADGVHLPGGEPAASEVRALWGKCSDRAPLIGVSAHSVEDVLETKTQGANFAVLAPVFEKVGTDVKGVGVEALKAAGATSQGGGMYGGGFSVLALGGVNLGNARACLEAGAAGVAGIRIFQNGDISETVRQLRRLG